VKNRYPGGTGPIAAVVLAGGRATRLGGADKPAITIRGRSLVAIAAGAALGAGARHTVIVGPPRPQLIGELRGEQPPPGPDVTVETPVDVTVEFTTEEPPGAGPVPALRAGLALVSEPWVILLAADLPFLRAGHLTLLLADARRAPAASGAIFIDDDGRPQWLASCWKTAGLSSALAGYEGSSLAGLLGPLGPVEVRASVAVGSDVPGSAPPLLDCDTSDDLAAARALAVQAEPTEK
jgi:molybdopterin-guanine dinucleotide biosynthesis protein A